MKHVTLYIVSAHEIFGFEEVIENVGKRKCSVKALFNNSIVNFIDKNDFLNVINMFKFSDKIN